MVVRTQIQINAPPSDSNNRWQGFVRKSAVSDRTSLEAGEGIVYLENQLLVVPQDWMRHVDRFQLRNLLRAQLYIDGSHGVLQVMRL